MVYYVHYFTPSLHHYAYHSTHSWLCAHWYLWHMKKAGYKEAYIEKKYEKSI